MKADFNTKIFSQKIHDYQMTSELDAERRIFLTNFTPLDFLCVVRIVKTLNSDRFLYENESYINRKVFHPNLLQIYQHFIVGNALISVMPYCEKGSIADLVKPTFGINESFTAMVLSDILKAVDYLHQNMIIHRAIKGSRILIICTGNKPFQFLLSGLKYALDMCDKTSLQSHEYPLNASKNLQSMAPEMFEQNIIGYNYKADIYSIGLLCCEMSNGVAPFHDAPTDELLLYKILCEQPLLFDRTVISDDWQTARKRLEDKKIKIPDDLKERHEKYSKRLYTKEFRDFVSVGCLHFEPAKRLSATELLEHSFMRNETERKYIM